jgi:hypothetical protein
VQLLSEPNINQAMLFHIFICKDIRHARHLNAAAPLLKFF